MTTAASTREVRATGIVWCCDACCAPISDGDGYMTAERSSSASLYPDTWRALHRGCDPRPDSSGYWIGIERIRTAVDVLEWCAHLGEKRWITNTNWSAVVRRAVRALRNVGA